jgi:hydrogenase-4 component B
MQLGLIVSAVVLAALSGTPSLLIPRASAWGQRVAAMVMTLSMVTGLTAIAMSVSGGPVAATFFPWPVLGDGLIGLDPLSCFFLAPVLLVGGLGSIYGLGYWPQKHHQENGQKLSFFWGLLVAGMVLLVIARHALIFLLGWEIMALSAFFLVAAEDEKKESRKASYVYLVATHIGTLSLFGLFVVWRLVTGSYDLLPVAEERVGLEALNVLFFLALLGFGLKAGVIPLHFWLPGAHAAAPTHVSAILSGVVLKMGIYGLVRVLGLLPAPPVAWGALLLVLGAVSGLLGVIFAIAQHDLKRLLAYHSVENIGIILMGLGLAVLGRSTGRSEWIVLGLAGCLLHVWNHSLFKSLLFFGAGSVIHQTRTREIDRLGGLMKVMPLTAVFFLIGAVAICGLPPLNGFVSELFIYLGLFGSLTKTGSGLAVALAVPVLAMIGALAVACFVKVSSAVFLGSPRTEATKHAKESSPALLIPMGILAFLCVLIGVGSVVLVPVLDQIIGQWNSSPSPRLPSVLDLSPLGPLGIFSGILLTVVAVLALGIDHRRRRAPTWDCGYSLPTGRMQYTASSLAQPVTRLFRWPLRPLERHPEIEGFFPSSSRMESHVDDPILDRLLAPSNRRLDRWAARVHRLQKGLAQLYITYIFIALIAMLVTLVPLQDLWTRLLTR